jgi:Flp pilus assembly protein TadG
MNPLTDKRGSVALMTGIMAPVMVMMLAMGIEVTSWSVANLELQRISDISAWAGARRQIWLRSTVCQEPPHRPGTRRP